MYILATHPEEQEILRKEIQSLPMDKNGHLKPDAFKNVPYLRACLKESMRLLPTTEGGLQRTAAHDLVIKGYHVPKGVSKT